MAQTSSKIKNLAIGDLVTHVLYGEEWVGMIIGFKDEGECFGNRSEKALVQIQPGTKYENFFKLKVSSKDRLNENLGYVTTNWLFKIEIKDAKFRSTRNQASKSGRED